MSLVSLVSLTGFTDAVAPLLALVPSLPVGPSPGLWAVGFSVALVAWLVAAEERDLRRNRAAQG